MPSQQLALEPSLAITSILLLLFEMLAQCIFLPSSSIVRHTAELIAVHEKVGFKAFHTEVMTVGTEIAFCGTLSAAEGNVVAVIGERNNEDKGGEKM